MFQRLQLAIFMLVFATVVRHAAAQGSGYSPRDIRGYSDKELAAEKKLLRDKSKSITWESLPLLEFPRSVAVPDSQQLLAKLGAEKYRELLLSKVEAAQKRFVDAKLKGRTFSGTVRIARKEPNGEEFTIYSNEPSRPERTEHSPHEFAVMWPAYFGQWQSDSDRSFQVGQTIDIVGEIEGLKEYGKSNTLFLKSVIIAAEAAKKKSQ